MCKIPRATTVISVCHINNKLESHIEEAQLTVIKSQLNSRDPDLYLDPHQLVHDR